MKHLLILAFFLFVFSGLNAQSAAFDYMRRSAQIPLQVCGNIPGEREKFEAAVEALSQEIEADAQRRAKILEDYARQNEDVMKNNMVKKSGISDAEMKKLQSEEGMSDAEQKAMVDRVLQQQAGITLDDAKNLQTMNKQQQEAWGTQHAAGQVQNAANDPNAILAGNQINRDMYELLAEQNDLSAQISDMENKLRLQYTDLIKLEDQAKASLETELQPLYLELRGINDGEGSTKADIAQAADVMHRIHVKQDAYCEKYSPDYLKFIAECRNSFEGMLSKYDRLEQIQNEVNGIQTGVVFPPESAGRLSILAVDQYLGYLKEAYRNKLYKPEP